MQLLVPRPADALEGSAPPGTGHGPAFARCCSAAEQEARALSAQITPQPRRPSAWCFRRQRSCRPAADRRQPRGAAQRPVQPHRQRRALHARRRPDHRWTGNARRRCALLRARRNPGVAPEHLPRRLSRALTVHRPQPLATWQHRPGLAIAKHSLQRHGAQLHIARPGSAFAPISGSSEAGERQPQPHPTTVQGQENPDAQPHPSR